MNRFPAIREHCGVFAVFGHPRAAELTYLGLHALQHRGEESVGIVSWDGSQLHRRVGLGLVAEVFSDRCTLVGLPGEVAMGHNRYGTSGATTLANAQPLFAQTLSSELALAHNGNLSNSHLLRARLLAEGCVFGGDSDSEAILHSIARAAGGDLPSKVVQGLAEVEGAYSLLLLNRDCLVALRDPHGFKPLCQGEKEGATIFASESCALDAIEADFVREIEPGEMMIVDPSGVKSYQYRLSAAITQCIFEFIYFARPDSRIFGAQVEQVRRKYGQILAAEKPAPRGEMVVAVPDSSYAAAWGYAQRAGLPFELGLIRNREVGRTFINPQPAKRNFQTQRKFNALSEVFAGRRVVLVDDSIVRGTTLQNLTGLIRHLGAAEIHLRIASPPICHPCFFGMDFPTREELIAAYHAPEEIRRLLDVDSLEYLPCEKLLEAVPNGRYGYCMACFNGRYPIEVDAYTCDVIDRNGDSLSSISDFKTIRLDQSVYK